MNCLEIRFKTFAVECTKRLFAELRVQSRELILDLVESCVNVKVGRESERIIHGIYLPVITAHLCGSGRTVAESSGGNSRPLEDISITLFKKLSPLRYQNFGNKSRQTLFKWHLYFNDCKLCKNK